MCLKHEIVNGSLVRPALNLWLWFPLKSLWGGGMRHSPPPLHYLSSSVAGMVDGIKVNDNRNGPCVVARGLWWLCMRVCQSGARSRRTPLPKCIWSGDTFMDSCTLCTYVYHLCLPRGVGRKFGMVRPQANLSLHLAASYNYNCQH